MAQGFVINALLNASKFIRGVKDMDDALDDLEGALEDAQEEVDRLDRQGDKAFDSLEDGADDAADEAKSLEKRLRDVRDATKDVGKAGENAGDDVRRGFKRAEDGVGEFKDEANSTAREAAASFDGSAESIGDAFQEVAANAFAGFGPAGAAAGIAAAAGVGLATQAFTEAQEAAQEAKEEAYAFAFAVLDSGKIAAEASAFRQITEDTEKMSEAQKIAKATGIELTDVIKAMATGDGLPALIDGLDKAAETGNNFELNGLITMLQGAQEGFKLGASGAEVFSEYLYDLATATGEATGEVDYLGRQIVALPDGKEVVIDAATKTATENIQRVKGDLNTVPEVVDSTVRVTVDDSAWRRWQPNPKTGQVNAQFGRYAV